MATQINVCRNYSHNSVIDINGYCYLLSKHYYVYYDSIYVYIVKVLEWYKRESLPTCYF